MRQPSSSPSLMRYLSVLVAGVILGTLATLVLVRALQARVDPFPRALMQVMERQLQQFGQGPAADRCDPADAISRLQSLRGLAGEIETAFPGLASDRRFAAQASRLRATLDAGLASPSACGQAPRIADDIQAACRGCHQDFR